MVGLGCCWDAMVLMIYNTNAALDDDLFVTLNGEHIATLVLPHSICAGRTWTLFGGPASTLHLPSQSIICSGSFVHSSIQQLPVGLNEDGTPNIIRVESLNDNNNGNFGNIWIDLLSKFGTNQWGFCRRYFFTDYSHPEGPPNFSERQFQWPPT